MEKLYALKLIPIGDGFIAQFEGSFFPSWFKGFNKKAVKIDLGEIGLSITWVHKIPGEANEMEFIVDLPHDIAAFFPDRPNIYVYSVLPGEYLSGYVFQFTVNKDDILKAIGKMEYHRTMLAEV